MIQIIGVKRIIVIVVLFLVNALLAAGLYLYVIPEKDKSDSQLRRVRTQVNTVRNDLARMEMEFEQLEEQQERFDSLRGGGFFSNQVRSQIKPVFTKAQRDSLIISAIVNVKSGVVEDNEEARKSRHKVLRSPVEVELKAFDDSNVYRYVELLLERFPGHLSVDHVTITRTRDVSPVLLRAIATGASPELIAAKIGMTWRTFIPEDQVIEGKR